MTVGAEGGLVPDQPLSLASLATGWGASFMGTDPPVAGRHFNPPGGYSPPEPPRSFYEGEGRVCIQFMVGEGNDELFGSDRAKAGLPWGLFRMEPGHRPSQPHRAHQRGGARAWRERPPCRGYFGGEGLSPLSR